MPEYAVEDGESLFALLARGHVALEAEIVRDPSRPVGDGDDTEAVPERRPVRAVVAHVDLDGPVVLDGRAYPFDRLAVGVFPLEKPHITTQTLPLVVAGDRFEAGVGVDERVVRATGVGDGDADGRLVHRPVFEPELALCGGDEDVDEDGTGDDFDESLEPLDLPERRAREPQRQEQVGDDEHGEAKEEIQSGDLPRREGRPLCTADESVKDTGCHANLRPPSLSLFTPWGHKPRRSGRRRGPRGESRRRRSGEVPRRRRS